ncbi:acyl-CoA reductase-like NAD-dependent aldehyde dehydrogenase [Pseudacidovorax sp. 1753]|uniref:aldehyde dehydrogenase family protein n=1 Tax=Pseudacidovorax sp. 1753 TaxID=3156419 RepID=UPI0033963FC2
MNPHSAFADDIFPMTIGGAAVHAAATRGVVDPATEDVFAQAPVATHAQLDDAVAAARAAQPGWAARPWAERQAVLGALAQLHITHQETLAQLLTREQGRPLPKARSELAAAAWWYGEYARMSLAPQVLQDTPAALVEVRRVPVGVVGAIVPWNYPIVLAAWKIAPALLAGNTLVLKPSPFTPLTTLRLGALMQHLLPPGVLNVVSGDDALGPWMTAHPGIDKVSFTGSTATGRRVMQSASANLKRLTLELGGNDAAIVMPDVDVEAAARALFDGAFANSGQICIAAKRLFVHDAIYDRFAAAFTALAKAARLGPGDQEGVDFGPVQNRPQYERLVALLADCRRRGHRFLAGGELPPGPGLFFPLTLLDDPPADSPVLHEEAFGPLRALIRFRDVDEAVARANASEYGLAGSVWCRDERLALAIAARLQTGTVWINEIQTASPHKPMAGHKQSGLGVENGEEGLREYTLPQTISMKRAS